MGNQRQTEIMEFSQAPTDELPAAVPVQILLVSKQIAAANAKRKHIILQNNGLEPCIVRLGDSAVSTANYNFVLSAATAARDGLGGSITIENYQGQILGICEANSTIISVTEIVKG